MMVIDVIFVGLITVNILGGGANFGLVGNSAFTKNSWKKHRRIFTRNMVLITSWQSGFNM
jgi:hypothetical protein